MNTIDHQNKPIVMIGSGLAAYTLIREYRKLNTEQAITVVTQESGDFYSKPMLSTAFASKKDAQQLISTNAAKMMEQLNIQIHSYSNVSAIILVITLFCCRVLITKNMSYSIQS